MDEKFEILDCAEMSDEELVRILTRDKEDYTETTLQRANREAWQRGLDVTQLINRVEVSLNDGEPESCTIDAALAKLQGETELWHVWHFTNCLHEKLTAQKEAAFWTLELFEGEQYQQSFFIKLAKDLEDTLAKFLRLSAEPYHVDFDYRLDDCVTIVDSHSSAYVKKVSQTLSAANIPHTVKIRAEYGLLVWAPADYEEAAQDLVAEIENKIASLRQEIARLVEKDKRHPQLLERYNELAQLIDHDATISYGQGVLLFEYGRNEDAATAFVQTAQFCMSSPKDWPPEYLEESESYLEHLAARLPEYLPLRHALANIALFNQADEKAKERFERILALAPADSVAHVNLGHLYGQDQHDRSRAVWHFQRYLELEPQAEDRAAIESMLAGL